MMMTLQSALAELEALGHEKVRAQNTKQGAREPQFGVRLGDIRKVAAKIKANDELAKALWETGNFDAQQLSILLTTPRNLSREEVDHRVRTVNSARVADWLSSYVVRNHPEKERMREGWMDDTNPWAARSGWDLTSERIGKKPEGLDLPALLDRIEAEMGGAAPEVQWTMNFCLAGIGIHFPEHRKRAVAIGEKLGLYRDWPVAKGCTPPFAPVWIDEMVRRKGEASSSP